MAKSDCTNILNLIPLYIDNMLSEEENDIVCKHIAGCKSCKGEYEFLKSIMAGSRSLPEIEVPKDFHENLMAKVKAEEKMQHTGRHKLLSWRSFAGIAAAAAVIAVSIVSYINLEGNGNSVNPDEFIPPVYPSEEPGQTNDGQGAEDVLLPDTDAEDEHRNEQTQSPEPNGTLTSEQSPAAAKTEHSQSRQQTSTGADKSAAETDNSPAPSAADSKNNQNNMAGAAGVTENASPSLAAQEDFDSNGISTFKSENADDVPSPNAVYSGNDTTAGSGGGNSNGSGSAAANPAMAERAVRYRVIHVSVAEEELDRAKELLAGYTKDKTGYRMEQDADSVLNKLSNLKGYRATDGAASNVDSDYIVLKGE